MIEEAYVSFEVAKLLKEKGFDIPCQKVWTDNKQLLWSVCFMEGNSFVNNEDIPLVLNYEKWSDVKDAYLAPTQQMAMRWLREKYLMNTFIGAKVYKPESGKISGYSAYVWYKPKNNQGICCYWVYPPQEQECWESYEDAYEAAIKYCLENLI